MKRIDRSRFLRLSGAGVGVALGGALTAGTARAALPLPAPKGDDLGFIQFGVVGESVSLAFYRTARGASILSSQERRRVGRAREAKARQLATLNAALGEDAIGAGDFTITLPDAHFVSREAIGRFGEQLESLLVAVYLNGVQNAEDRATRLLIGRLLAFDVQQLAWLRALRGAPDFTRVPSPLSVELGGAQLDRFLSTPGVEPS